MVLPGPGVTSWEKAEPKSHSYGQGLELPLLLSCFVDFTANPKTLLCRLQLLRFCLPSPSRSPANPAQPRSLEPSLETDPAEESGLCWSVTCLAPGSGSSCSHLKQAAGRRVLLTGAQEQKTRPCASPIHRASTSRSPKSSETAPVTTSPLDPSALPVPESLLSKGNHTDSGGGKEGGS